MKESFPVEKKNPFADSPIPKVKVKFGLGTKSDGANDQG
jgi:hypothetical protein